MKLKRKQQTHEERWRSLSHPKRVAWREAMGLELGRKRRGRRCGTCYGVCCDEYQVGGTLCTVCRKYGAAVKCCGHFTVKVNPRIRVPRTSAEGRWKLFLRRFPRFAYDEGLRAVRCEVCGDDYAVKHGKCPREHGD